MAGVEQAGEEKRYTFNEVNKKFFHGRDLTELVHTDPELMELDELIDLGEMINEVKSESS